MSTSLLYHGFGIIGFQHLRTKFNRGTIEFTIQHSDLRCSLCNSPKVIRRGVIPRSFKTIPIGNKPVVIKLNVQRVKCEKCGFLRQAKINFTDYRRSYSKNFERYALDLLQHMTIQDVAQHLGISWDVIKDIQKRYLIKHFSTPKLKSLCRIAIDEISIGKGHKYLTVVLDLVIGRVVYVGDGKGTKALEPFWKRLKRSKAKIEAVAIDMSPS